MPSVSVWGLGFLAVFIKDTSIALISSCISFESEKKYRACPADPKARVWIFTEHPPGALVPGALFLFLCSRAARTMSPPVAAAAKAAHAQRRRGPQGPTGDARAQGEASHCERERHRSHGRKHRHINQPRQHVPQPAPGAAHGAAQRPGRGRGRWREAVGPLVQGHLQRGEAGRGFNNLVLELPVFFFLSLCFPI